MAGYIFLAIIALLIILSKIADVRDKRRYYRNNSNGSSPRSGKVESQTSRHNQYSYRPSAKRGTSGIKFSESSNIALNNIEGLHDAFTGEALRTSLGIYQCNNCKVYYHRESYEVLRQENSGKCVSCSSTSIYSLTNEQTRSSRGRDNEISIVTLDNYRNYQGRIITFEGYVPRINVAKDGISVAVMFENTSWTRGLKLVVFRGKITKVGGNAFLKNLKGRTVRVRGLLTCHPTYGWQIIVTERSMILSVK